MPPLARGDHLGAFALTEAESGSDAGSLRTSARPDGDGWRIDGAKQWITNGSHAGTFVLFARTNEETRDARGVSCFVLDGDHVRVTRVEEKLGLNSSATVDIVVEGAQVGRDRLLGDENHGFRIAMSTLDGGRIGIAAQALGIAQAAFDTARVRPRAPAVRAKDRGLPGDPVEARRHVDRDRRGTPADPPRSLAEGPGAAAHGGGREGEALRLGDGAQADRGGDPDPRRLRVDEGVLVERYYRDAKITEIYEGTSEVQRLMIARSLLRSATEAVAKR